MALSAQGTPQGLITEEGQELRKGRLLSHPLSNLQNQHGAQILRAKGKAATWG